MNNRPIDTPSAAADATPTQLLVWGVNHHSAPVQVREQLALAPAALPALLQDLQQSLQVAATPYIAHERCECVVISTCNRMECYVVAPTALALEPLLHQVLTRHLGSTLTLAPEYLFIKQELAAAQHLFAVIAGLDSMVLGETQITGQVKKALRTAQEVKSSGPQLNHLFQSGFHIAKQVRQHTGISQQVVSYAAAALQLCRRVFGDLHQESILLIGAGEMIELCATHFAAQQTRQLTIANRTRAHAQVLALRHGAQVLDFAALSTHLAHYDIIVSCTAATAPIIQKNDLENVLKTRRNKPMVLIDLAVPRDIDSKVGKLAHTYLYTVDDLGEIAAQGRAARGQEAMKAQALITHHLAALTQWQARRQLVPQIKALHERVDSIRRAELQRAQRQLENGEEPSAVLQKMSQRLSTRLADSALATAHQAEPADKNFLHRWLPRLFLPSRRHPHHRKL